MQNSKKELILTALLSNPTVREASAACAIPENTIYRWLRKPEFKMEYESRKSRIVDDSANYLQIKLEEATKTILAIMTSPATPSQTRLNAARSVFEYCFKFIEQKEVIARLDALEECLRDDEK